MFIWVRPHPFSLSFLLFFSIGPLALSSSLAISFLSFWIIAIVFLAACSFLFFVCLIVGADVSASFFSVLYIINLSVFSYLLTMCLIVSTVSFACLFAIL